MLDARPLAAYDNVHCNTRLAIMSATERVVVLMSAEEKTLLEAKALQAGRISAGELIRRAVAAYDEEEAREAGELRALLDAVAVTHAETVRALDRTERKLDGTLASLRRRDRRT